MGLKRVSRGGEKIKKLNFVIWVFCIFILNGCTNNREQTSQISSNINSVSSEKNMTDSSKIEISDDKRYPTISKELLNGKSWYEGASSNVLNQPREGFNAGKFYDLFGNFLDYEINVSETEKKFNIMDSVKNKMVPINILTEIRVNKPDVKGNYRDVFFPLYYKYDGTLMIAQSNSSSDNYEFTSYPLEDVPLSNIENETIESNGDLDINAIDHGDFTSLVGTWVNGNNDVLIINNDGSTNKNLTVYGVTDSGKKSKIPYASLSSGEAGGAGLGLYKIGFKNPDGDTSDSTKARLTIAQQGGNYPSEVYYYRK